MRRLLISVLLASCSAIGLLAGEAPPPPTPPPAKEAATPPQPRPQPPTVRPASAAPGQPMPTFSFGPATPVQTAEAAEANPAFLNDLAQVYLRYGVLDKAEPLLRTAMEKAKDPAQKQQALSSLAQVLQRKGDAKGAAELYEQALQGAANPSEKARMQMSLAESYAGMNEFEKAEKILNEIAASTDQNPMAGYQRQEAQRQLAQIWQKQPGRLDKVIEEAEKAVAANPKDAVALERLAEIYSRAKPDAAKATLCYEKLLALRPEDKNLLVAGTVTQFWAEPLR